MITPGGGRGLAQSNVRVTLSDGRPDAALAQVDDVLGVEREVKRAHITLLIQIKNTLAVDDVSAPPTWSNHASSVLDIGQFITAPRLCRSSLCRALHSRTDRSPAQ